MENHYNVVEIAVNAEEDAIDDKSVRWILRLSRREEKTS